MIKRYRIGNPIETEAVVKDVPVSEGMLPKWETDEKNRSLKLCMTEKTRIYGLGETVRGMNKRGWLYESNNQDEPYHMEEKHSLYASQNFFLVTGEGKPFGLYVDTPGIVRFDMGYTHLNELVVSFEDFDADLYLVEGETEKEIVKEFRGLIGESYLPPKWAFGFGQSRWSYETSEEVREVVRRYREEGIPLDMVYLDIDYMERYKDFTVDPVKFPDFADFVQEMKGEGVRLIPIIDAGVKIEEGYPVYEEGVKNGYFCKKEDGTELVAAVWPGRVHFPDFLNEDARRWFGNWYKVLLDQGIEGFWNDMNEPSIFYTEDHLTEVFDQIEEYKGMNLDVESFFEFKDLVSGLDHEPEDYKRFYHLYHGKRIRHDKVHNLFGFNMTKAAGEAFERLSPEKKILMFSRSSFIGMHRYGGIWCGDNRSWWSHILLNLQQMPALSMTGFLYSGADTGGFIADCTEDLLLRWTALSIFMPLFRNHSAKDTRRQEFYAFDSISVFRNFVRLRYALLPYLYESFERAVKENGMLMTPLAFEYPEDERAVNVEDQLLVGESIMIAPVYVQNAKGRYVYLPEDMLELRFKSDTEFQKKELPKGDHYVEVPLDEVVIFLRKGHSLPLSKSANSVGELDFTPAMSIDY